MPFIIRQPQRDPVFPYVFYDKLFSPDECQKIIDESAGLERREAKVGSNNTTEGVLDPVKRVSDVYWIDWAQRYNDIFTRLEDAVFTANQKWWGFHLAGLNEALQLTHYKAAEQKGHYDWHEDWDEKGAFSQRKLSGVILLSDKFTGGQFEFLHRGAPPELTLGSMILFPSFRTHRVNPVTEGERWSLVFWVSGPPFC